MPEPMVTQTDAPLGPIDEENPPSQQEQQVINIPHQRSGPNLPKDYLLKGPREDYLKIGVPLYEASIKCDWKAAKAIIDNNPELELVRYGITENGETALHVAASAKVPKKVESFVKNLVDLMTEADLELENENCNTALYLAAAAGNIKTVKIMMEKNENLLTIPGGGSKYSKPQMMPLYTAALFGNPDVVSYMYKKSNDLMDDHVWSPKTRGWLLEKCIENNMFDIALSIVNNHKDLASNGSLLGLLARKPDAFSVKKDNYVWRFIIWVLGFIGVIFPEKEGKALPLLKIIWEDIAKMNKKEIDKILRGPPDVIKQDKRSAGWAVQTTQLQKLLSGHLQDINAATNNIMGGPLDSVKQDTVEASIKVDQAQKLANLISEHIVSMHHEIENIYKQENKPVCGRGDQALELQKLIYEHIANMHDESQKIRNTLRKEDQAQQFQKLIAKHVKEMPEQTHYIMKKATYSSRVLFNAAELGNTNFLIQLIRKYPDLIWKVDDNNQSIFHIAVKHRHEGIYNLLYEIGSMKDLITPMRDPKDNTMLHLVGKSAKQKRLQDVSGVALQMQRELLWFEEVKKMIPLSYRERRNQDDLTPHELFTKEHKELVTQGEKWMKGTASQCMVVAALIATIVFAAAFTVPGGYAQSDDKDNGIPVFHSQATFMVFVVADAISLFASSASILMFLSILTSRYAERDFLESLPKKLMLGLATLFLSITTMTVAFSVSFFVLYHKGLLWMPILIGVFAVMPVFLYIWLQYSLFFDVIRSTYRSRYLFKPKKHVLYYENPKV